MHARTQRLDLPRKIYASLIPLVKLAMPGCAMTRIPWRLKRCHVANLAMVIQRALCDERAGALGALVFGFVTHADFPS
jgi:hypothetical protein